MKLEQECAAGARNLHEQRRPDRREVQDEGVGNEESEAREEKEEPREGDIPGGASA